MTDQSSWPACQVCKRTFKIITSSHLKSHGYTFETYRAAFPGVDLVDSSQKERLRARNQARKGTKLSKATKDAMSASHTGKKHSQATKDAIGAAHAGKILPQHVIDAMKAGTAKAIAKNNGMGLQKGKKRSKKFKDRMSEVASARPREVQLDRATKMQTARRGSKATPEQRETYRAARLKYMAENPAKPQDTAGERQIKEWLIERNITYREQWTIKMFGHPYDFFLPESNTLIEFDGTHHWERVWFGVSGKNDQEKAILLEEQKAKDARENMEAGQSGYRVIRLYGRTKVGDCSDWPDLEIQLRIQGFQW